MKSESGFSLAMASQPFQEGAFSGTIVAASITQQSRRVRPFQPMQCDGKTPKSLKYLSLFLGCVQSFTCYRGSVDRHISCSTVILHLVSEINVSYYHFAMYYLLSTSMISQSFESMKFFYFCHWKVTGQ